MSKDFLLYGQICLKNCLAKQNSGQSEEFLFKLDELFLENYRLLKIPKKKKVFFIIELNDL